MVTIFDTPDYIITSSQIKNIGLLRKLFYFILGIIVSIIHRYFHGALFTTLINFFLRRKVKLKYEKPFYIGIEQGLKFYFPNKRVTRILDGIEKQANYIFDSYLLEELEINSDDIVVDCGANVGEFYQGLRSHFENFVYIGFEPDPNVYECLKKNITSKNATIYNQALSYKSSNSVWAVSGWGHPQLINFKTGSSFSSLTSPWGWGTWKNNWNIFIENKLYEKNLISELSDKDKNQFLFYGYADYWEEAIKKDLSGENSVWDAYWYQTIYINKGLTLFPNTSHVQNNGFDGSGIHCKENDLFFTPLNNKKTLTYPKKFKINIIYKLNTYLFFLNYRRKQYFDYHSEKFSSFKNFKLFILKKIKSKFFN